MSGSSGRPITAILMAEPAVGQDGKLAPWFGQFLQRLVDYVGSGGSGGTGLAQNITETVNNLTATTNISLGTAGADGATLARIADLERAVEIAPLPPAHVRDGVPALPPQVNLSALLDQTFGSARGTVLFRGHYGWQGLPPGTSGQKLTSGGAGADVSWV